MGIFLGWLIFSFVVGAIGSNRKIGFISAFLLSLILSPLLGLIFTLTSKTNYEEKYESEMLETQKSQKETLNKISDLSEGNFSKKSIIDELEGLKKMREDGLVSEEEFKIIKNKIIKH